MGVSKNRGTPPKWMVYNGKLYEQMDDLGENPLFSETSNIENLSGFPVSRSFFFFLHSGNFLASVDLL